MKYLYERKLSDKAADLIRFDADSIRQVAAAERLAAPDVWIADPDAYEKDGRVFRDSPSARMLAYSRQSRVVYATDGCNSCARKLPVELEKMPEAELVAFARDNDLSLDLLKRLCAENTPKA